MENLSRECVKKLQDKLLQSWYSCLTEFLNGDTTDRGRMEVYQLLATDFNNLNISEKNFFKLLDYCFENCQLLTLSNIWPSGWKNDDMVNNFIDSIQKYNIRNFRTNNWFCMHNNTEEALQHYAEVPEDGDGFFDVYLYETHPGLKEILKKTTDNLFFNTYDKTKSRYSTAPHSLEDLCFFKDNLLFLGTLSHEQICLIYPETAEQLIFFNGLTNNGITSFEKGFGDYEINHIKLQ